jgi:hypothetical protein
MTTNTNINSQSNATPTNDHFIIETTSQANSFIYSVVSNAIENHPYAKKYMFVKSQAGGVLQLGIAWETEEQGEELAEFIGGVIGSIAALAIPTTWGVITIGAISTGLVYLGSFLAEEIYQHFTDSKTQAQQNPQDLSIYGINTNELLSNASSWSDLYKIKNEEYHTKLKDYTNQLKAIIEQDLPPQDIQALQQEINLFKSAYTDKAQGYQDWNEDYTNYQEFKQQYDNWQQQDTIWKQKYQELTEQTQDAQTKLNTAQQNYDEWNTQHQDWITSTYNTKEQNYTDFKNSYDTQASNYQSWVANAQSVVNNSTIYKQIA